MAIEVQSSYNLHFFLTNETIIHFDMMLSLLIKESKRAGFKRLFTPEQIEILEDIRQKIDEQKEGNSVLLHLKQGKPEKTRQVTVTEYPVDRMDIE